MVVMAEAPRIDPPPAVPSVIETAARLVYDTFVRDEAQGYHTRDREFVIVMLGAALKGVGEAPVHALLALVGRWRKFAQCSPPYSEQGVIKAYRQCADELEAALGVPPCP